MSKHIFWTFTVTVAVLALSLSAIAQPPGGGRGPGGGMGMGGGPGGGGMMGPGMMFQNPEFAKMLNLTPEQTRELQGVMQSSMEEFRQQMQEQMRNSPPGTPPNPGAMRERMDQFMDATQSKIDRVFQAEQRTKFREITFQMSGGLNSPLGLRSLETLNLSDAQKDQVRSILANRDAEFMRAVEGRDFRDMSPEEREKFGNDMRDRTQRFAVQISNLLTPEQKAKADKLNAEAPALREKLGMPAPGQGRGQQSGQGGPSYLPGANSWRPGQGAPPSTDTPPSQPRRSSGFPRGERQE